MADLDIDVAIKPPPKVAGNRFIDFIASAGGAALMTVLLGGVVAQLISCDAQRRSQQREFNNAWLKARGDQALMARKDYVDGGRAAVDEIFRTIGTMATASEELVDITQPSFGIGKLGANDRKTVLRMQTTYYDQFTAAERSWAPSQQRFTFLISYFSSGDAATAARWRELRDAVNEHRKCATAIYVRWYQHGQGIGSYTYNSEYCRTQQRLIDTKAELFGQNFGRVSDRLWIGWENPGAMKRLLKIDD